MSKIAFVSCLYNPADFSTPIKNAENFMKYTVDKAFSASDFYFCQVLAKYCKSIKKELIKGNYLELQSESVLWPKRQMLLGCRSQKMADQRWST